MWDEEEVMYGNLNLDSSYMDSCMIIMWDEGEDHGYYMDDVSTEWDDRLEVVVLHGFDRTTSPRTPVKMTINKTQWEEIWENYKENCEE